MTADGSKRDHRKVEQNDGVGGSATLQHEDLTFRIIGCAQRVHAALGPGFPEAVYHRAMSLELVRTRIPFESEKAYEVTYRGSLCGEFRADLVVEAAVVVELKALAGLNGDHVAQVLAYLKASGLKVGLLFNFGRKSLETKRLVF